MDCIRSNLDTVSCIKEVQDSQLDKGLDQPPTDTCKCVMCKKMVNVSKVRLITGRTCIRFNIQKKDLQPGTMCCNTCYFRGYERPSRKSTNKQVKSRGSLLMKAIQDSTSPVDDTREEGNLTERQETMECEDGQMVDLIPGVDYILPHRLSDLPDSWRQLSPIDSPSGVDDAKVVKETLDSLVQKVADEVAIALTVEESVKKNLDCSKTEMTLSRLRKGKCGALFCTGSSLNYRKRCSIPRKFFSLPAAAQEKIKSAVGMPDDCFHYCRQCYKKINRRILFITQNKNNPGYELDRTSDASETETSTSKHMKTKLFACGWCRFRSMHSKTVVRHHYQKHQNKELDVVRLKSRSPKQNSPRQIGFNCDSCSFSGRFRHQLHLHNDKYHINALNRDGITDYESDSVYNPVYPSLFYNKVIPRNLFQMQEEFCLKEMKVECRDVFQFGIEGLLDIIAESGVQKLCVDSLTEKEFITMATRYKEFVTYVDTNRENSGLVELRTLNEDEIASIIRK